MVKIPFRWLNVMGDKEGDKEGDKKTSLSKTQLRILIEMKNDPNITKPKLESKLGVGKTAIDRGIAVLKKNGYIERTGSNKSGHWKVLKEC